MTCASCSGVLVSKRGSLCRPCFLAAIALKPKPCAVCAVEFTPNRKKDKVCSEACRRAAISNAVSARFTPMEGLRFGSLEVVDHHRADRCACKCDCGAIEVVRTEALKSQDKTICTSCARRERLARVTDEVKLARVRASRDAQRTRNHDDSDALYFNHGATDRVSIKRAAINKIKSAPCMDCGLTFPAVCMDFDHRPGEI
jgi:hypothetical protein